MSQTVLLIVQPQRWIFALADVPSPGRRGQIRVRAVEVLKGSMGDGSIRDQLAEAVSKHRASDADAWISLPRTDVEIRTVPLPNVPEDELPDMVRLQSTRQFSSATDRSIIDFVPRLRTDSGVEVLAAAMDGRRVAEIRAACEFAGLQPSLLTARPLVATSLTSAIATSSANTDIAMVSGGETDLVLIRDGHVASARTIRTPTDMPADALVAAVTGDLKRTRLSCGETGEPSCELAIFTDAATAAEPTWATVAKSTTVIACDTQLTGWCESISGEASVGDHDGHDRSGGGIDPSVAAEAWAIALQSTANDDQRLNFLQPRRRPEPRSNRLRNVLAAVAAALLMAAGAGLVWYVLNDRDRAIAEVDREIASMNGPVEDAEITISELERVDQFLDGDVMWLDELRALARQSPPSEQLILDELRGETDARTGGGTITVKGRVTKPEVIDNLAAAMRSDHRDVIGEAVNEVKGDDAYRFSFAQAMEVSADWVRDSRYQRFASLMASEPAKEAGEIDDAIGEDAPDAIEMASETLQESTSGDASVEPTEQSPSDADDAPAGDEVST